MRKYVMTISDYTSVQYCLEFINEKANVSNLAFVEVADSAIKFAIEKDTQANIKNYEGQPHLIKPIGCNREDVIERMAESGFTIVVDEDIVCYDFNEDIADGYSEDMSNYILDRAKRINQL